MKDTYINLGLEEKIEYLKTLHGYDLANLYNSLSESEQQEMFDLLSNEDKAELLTYIVPSEASEILESLETTEVTDIIELMEPDDVVDIVEESDSDKVETWIEGLDDEDREDIQALIDYDEDEAGSIMTSNIILLKPEQDVKEAMKILVKEAPDVESIQTMFVTDKNGIFLGVVPLKKLIKAKSPMRIEELYETSVSVYDSDDVDDVTNTIQEEGIYQMPVVSEDNRLLGMITLDDALDVYEEEAIEDVQKLSGLSESYGASLVKSALSRLPWLLLLVVFDLPIAAIMSGFEGVLSTYTIIIIFQPLILDMAGNFGTQTLSTSLVFLNIGEEKNYMFHAKEEFKSSILIGLLMGFVSFLFTMVIITLNSTLNHNGLLFGTAVGISMFFSLIICNSIGTLLPKFLHKLGFDPANASGPLLTTIADISSILIYYGITLLLLEVFV
ncbi:MAG: magnesium transporter [Acholeplasmataceae bacterium]|nr:magnesium transporter [Acholeplasmataceae bacterium]